MKSINILQLHEDQGGGGEVCGPGDTFNPQGDGNNSVRPSLVAYSSAASMASLKNGGQTEVDSASSDGLEVITGVTDARALLAQKEKDLILAAELGKALLEKNEDLSQQNEKMAEEFSKQLEVGLYALVIVARNIQGRKTLKQ